MKYTLVTADNELDFLEELNTEISKGSTLAKFHYDFRIDTDEHGYVVKHESFIALLEWPSSLGDYVSKYIETLKENQEERVFGD